MNKSKGFTLPQMNRLYKPVDSYLFYMVRLLLLYKLSVTRITTLDDIGEREITRLFFFFL